MYLPYDSYGKFTISNFSQIIPCARKIIINLSMPKSIPASEKKPGAGGLGPSSSRAIGTEALERRQDSGGEDMSGPGGGPGLSRPPSSDSGRKYNEKLRTKPGRKII
jgi:hypothetical protein